jgi:hypothetical protein
MFYCSLSHDRSLMKSLSVSDIFWMGNESCNSETKKETEADIVNQ